jgi:hypothetical protein
VAWLTLIACRTFTHSDLNSLPGKVILNEKAVSDLGLDQAHAVGALVTMNPYAD